MSMHLRRRTTLSVLGVALAGVLGVALAGVLAASPSIASSSPEHMKQPYHHLTTKDFGTGGAYVSTGGDVSLKLTGNPGGAEVLVEECDGPDLGDVVRFPKGASKPQVLATDLEAGTCFVMLLKSTDGKSEELAGTLSY